MNCSDKYLLPSVIAPHTQYIIHGMVDGKTKFRPSDWTERLVCVQPQQLKKYQGQLKISRTGDYKRIIFTNKLEGYCNITFNRLLDFARINNLRVEIIDLTA